MKIIVAPNAFKESLGAIAVAQSIARGVHNVLPDAQVVQVPVADGGDGTTEALVASTDGRMIQRRVTGPLGQPVEANFGLLGDGQTAVVEMAVASGLHLVPEDKRNPLKTTTYGTGELIAAALDQGAKKVIVGIGGSATVDGGAGMAQALGCSLLDDGDRDIPRGGQGLPGFLEWISANGIPSCKGCRPWWPATWTIRSSGREARPAFSRRKRELPRSRWKRSSRDCPISPG